MKRELLQLLIRTLKEQEALIVVCVLASSGSTPRGSGATMLVFEDGHTEGTIGAERWSMPRNCMPKNCLRVILRIRWGIA